MNHDPETIRRLVAEVVARITAQAATSVAPKPAAASSYGQPQGATAVTVAEKVVTLAALERLPSGTARVVVATNAVITPSAREHARDAGIEIVRATATTAATVPASRPFIVAHADGRGDAAGRCASIVRSVPGAQQLPATGLADVVTAIATHASRDGARGILLTGRPAAAVILANRSASLRAVTARDAASLLAAAAECSANLLIIDPTSLSTVSLERVASDFGRRDLGPAPAELRAAPTPCACQGHAH